MTNENNFFPANNPPPPPILKGESTAHGDKLSTKPSFFGKTQGSVSPENKSVLLPQEGVVKDPRIEKSPQNIKQKKIKSGVKIPKKAIVAVLGILLFSIVGLIVAKLIATPITEQGQIVWWGTKEEKEVVDELIKEYEQSHPGVKIVYEKQSETDYRERLTNALASGKGPDIFEIHNSWTPMFANNLDTMPSSVMDQSEYSQVFYPAIVSDLVRQNGIVGIPIQFDVLVLYINQSIFSNAAKSPPTSWDDLKNLSNSRGGLTLTNESGLIVQSGVALGITENVDHWQEIVALMLMQNKVNMLRPTEPDPVLAADALWYYRQFGVADKTWDDTLPRSTLAFSGGKLAMYFAPTSRAYEIVRQNPSLKFVTVPVPQLPKNSAEDTDLTYATYWFNGVSKSTRSKTQAWEFLKFMSDRESQIKLSDISKTKGFLQRFYPRKDMNDLVLGDAILGAGAKLAPVAKSWYLASNTNDGETGINSQLSGVFSKAILSVKDQNNARNVVGVLETDLSTVLSKFGIRTR